MSATAKRGTAAKKDTTEQAPRSSPINDSGKLLGPSEAGKLIGKSSQTIRRWCRDGLIRAVRGPGGGWMIPRDQFDSLRRHIESLPSRV